VWQTFGQEVCQFVSLIFVCNFFRVLNCFSSNLLEYSEQPYLALNSNTGSGYSNCKQIKQSNKICEIWWKDYSKVLSGVRRKHILVIEIFYSVLPFCQANIYGSGCVGGDQSFFTKQDGWLLARFRINRPKLHTYFSNFSCNSGSPEWNWCVSFSVPLKALNCHWWCVDRIATQLHTWESQRWRAWYPTTVRRYGTLCCRHQVSTLRCLALIMLQYHLQSVSFLSSVSHT